MTHLSQMTHFPETFSFVAIFSCVWRNFARVLICFKKIPQSAKWHNGFSVGTGSICTLPRRAACSWTCHSSCSLRGVATSPASWPSSRWTLAVGARRGSPRRGSQPLRWTPSPAGSTASFPSTGSSPSKQPANTYMEGEKSLLIYSLCKLGFSRGYRSN